MLPVLAVGYLVASLVAPPAAAAAQQWLSVLYTARYDNPAGGDLFLPGGTLDPVDLLNGVGANTKIVVGAFISITQPGIGASGTVQISNAVDVAATVVGKKKPKLVARLKGNLVKGAVDLTKTVPAKKLIDKGPLTFEVTTTGAEVTAYTADATYYVALAAAARAEQ